jgi:hypothetical protein
MEWCEQYTMDNVQSYTSESSGRFGVEAARQILVMCTSLWKLQVDGNKCLLISEMEIVLMIPNLNFVAYRILLVLRVGKIFNSGTYPLCLSFPPIYHLYEHWLHPSIVCVCTMGDSYTGSSINTPW